MDSNRLGMVPVYLYMEGSQVIISKNIMFLSLKINFILANSADLDEMLHHIAFLFV